MGLLREVFPEAASLKLLFRGEGEFGYREEKTKKSWREMLCGSSSLDESSENSQECISLQGIHCGRGGSNGFALVTSW